MSKTSCTVPAEGYETSEREFKTGGSQQENEKVNEE